MLIIYLIICIYFIFRACPECRVKSDFVTPSQFWVDSKEEKQKLIEGYKDALRYENKKRIVYYLQVKKNCLLHQNPYYLSFFVRSSRFITKPPK